jgi:hypothetical protein
VFVQIIHLVNNLNTWLDLHLARLLFHALGSKPCSSELQCLLVETEPCLMSRSLFGKYDYYGRHIACTTYKLNYLPIVLFVLLLSSSVAWKKSSWKWSEIWSLAVIILFQNTFSSLQSLVHTHIWHHSNNLSSICEVNTSGYESKLTISVYIMIVLEWNIFE